MVQFQDSGLRLTEEIQLYRPINFDIGSTKIGISYGTCIYIVHLIHNLHVHIYTCFLSIFCWLYLVSVLRS